MARARKTRRAGAKAKRAPRRATAKRTTAKRGSGKRDLVKAKNATFFATRTAEGQFKEMVERGRSLKADRRRKATRAVRSGYGNRGDRTA
jgi:hypothetical protein